MVHENISHKIDSMFPYKSIKLISGVDRYGFSDILAAQLGLKYKQRSFANWLHGWIWWGGKNSEELMLNYDQKDWIRCIVSNYHQKAVLESEGFKHVWVGGLPFAYTLDSSMKRNGDSLLAMPPHSDESEKINRPYLEYLDYLESIKGNYSSVWVSIFYLNKCTDIIHQINRRGLMFLDGARPDDANSLRRLRAIFDNFEYVTSNTMGSHIIYSIYCGCKTSFCGPMYTYDESMFLGDFGQNRYSKQLIEDTLYYLSYGYLSEYFNFLFTPTPREGYISREYGEEEIGFNNRMKNEEILDALQWGWRNQVSGYFSGGLRRIRRSVGYS